MRFRTAPALSPSLPKRASPAGPDAQGFGVYVHWPFCASKCPYCDFNSHVRLGGVDEARFLRALLAELAHWARSTPGRTVTSVFFGGGTPSLMSAGAVGAIIDAIASHWRLQADVEITLEANPSSVEAERFRAYRSAGVNRVSLGVQSLKDTDLKMLGRLHSAAEARAAIAVAERNFDRFSFDLICARPGQTVEEWRKELAEALTMAGRHLSLYQLTIESGTPFADLHARGKLRVPDGEAARLLYEATQELTEAAGLPAYEISNHAATGEECRQNLLYWRYGEYVGIGPGAHGRVLLEGTRHATATERQPERWAASCGTEGHGIVECVALTRAEQADEAVLMGLRMSEGVDLHRLAEISALRPRAESIEDLIRRGLLTHCRETRLQATAAGRIVLDKLVLQLTSALEPVAPEPAAIN
jgi:oxygen-independent coproporphyrinogen-3 oxidase